MNRDHRPVWNIVLRSALGPIDERFDTLMQIHALDQRVMLTFHEPEHCRADFHVRGHDMASAVNEALSRWARVSDAAQLPDGAIVELTAHRLAHSATPDNGSLLSRHLHSVD